MSEILDKEVARRKKNRRRRAVWKRVVHVLSCIVVFCTVYALVLDAVTMGDEPVCGMEAHEHTALCSRTHVLTSACPAVDEVVLHSHDERCYDQWGSLWCPLPERTEHLHSDGCFETVSALVCPIDEVEPHFHDESCQGQLSVLSCNQGDAHVHGGDCFQQVQIQSCELHVHDESCYTEDELVCAETEHVHDEGCYAESERVCAEADHVHGDECYTSMEVQVCDTQDHVHDESCYILTDGYVCGKEETAGHTHGEGCYELRTHTVCGLEQVAAHSHDEGCLDENGNEICGIVCAEVHIHGENCVVLTALPEAELLCTIPEHIHTEGCYPQPEVLPTVEPGFLCGMGEHTHAEACVDENGQQVCTLTEHIHNAPCLVKDYDGNADVESAADWEASLSGVTLTGNYAQDILAIAQSQLGYQESSRNVWLCADGSLKGYTRYGAWYGIPYGDWCAMFASFCVHYAGAAEVPLDSVCNTYIEQLTQAEMFRPADQYIPKPGDLVFMDWERTGGEATDVDHMGIVAQIVTDENGVPVQLVTIEGNWDNCVQYRTYDYASPVFVGFGQIPMGNGRVQVCQENHVHEDGCYGWRLFFENEDIQGNVVITGMESLPDDLTVAVNSVTEDDGMTYGAMNAAVELEMEQSPYYVGGVGLYRMVLSTGEGEFALPDGASATVELTFSEAVFEESAVAEGSGLKSFLLASGEPISLLDGTVIDTYEVQESLTTGYENAAQGLTGMTVELGNQQAFAVVLTSSTIEGQFWTRVTSKNQITANSTYMIISAQGQSALRGSGSGNYASVILETVKGNTGYYTIKPRSGTIDNDFYWSITPNGNNFVVQNQKQANYLYLARTGFFGSPSLLNSSSARLTFTYATPENCWRINNGNYYLRNASGTSFAADNGADTTQYNVAHYFSRNMLIFKLSNETSLKIPDDVAPSTEPGNKAPEKPDYDDFIVPTDQKTGDTSLTKGELTVEGNYYSDQATSDIENKFRMDTYAESQEIDGKIVTDKSVIYMGDDYGAFDNYASNTFGVTLSALGQEYEMPHEDIVRTPIDVVFVLDVSGSMSTTGNGSNAQRAVDMVDACNKTIKRIMENHPENRVGVVLYATGAWKLLPLDRYQANEDKYLMTNPTDTTQNGATKTIYYVQTTASLKNEDGVSYANLGGNKFNQGWGTYTQAGIALGYETFQAVTDTTYTVTFGSGEEQREYTVVRQPVYILLSDGEPTHCSPFYMDPIAGPHYGDGKANPSNAQGVVGFNTVLSANYFKRMAGIHYGKPALFYTIGMDITETGDKSNVAGSETGDTYKRAVLNPTKENVNALNSSLVGGSNVNTQFKELITGTYTGSNTVTLLSQWPDPWTGNPQTVTPMMPHNPYADNYSYADDAYFGTMNDKDLEEIFSKIVALSMRETPYGFILHKSSSINITDVIGTDMEIKGVPVLRYGGVNYQPVRVEHDGLDVRYIYEGTYTHPHLKDRVYDIAEIEVWVREDDHGHQVVTMYIPDTVLPVYTPELIGKEFYYEMLPARLIYQVGLTAEGEQKVMDLYKTGGTATFYTNRWEEGIEQAVSNLYPSMENPFYYEILPNGLTRYEPHHDLKGEGDNVTDTLEYSIDCNKGKEYVDGDTITKVIHMLGNNGKLVFSVPEVDIPVEKQWAVTPDEGMEIEVDIFNVQVTDTGKEEPTRIKTVKLNAENGWKGVFKDMPVLASGYYAIAERIPDGFLPQYSGEVKTLVIDNRNVQVAVVDLTDIETIPVTVVTNHINVVLPATGGMGTTPIYISGMLLLAAAVYIVGFGRLRRKEGE